MAKLTLLILLSILLCGALAETETVNLEDDLVDEDMEMPMVPDTKVPEKDVEVEEPAKESNDAPVDKEAPSSDEKETPEPEAKEEEKNKEEKKDPIFGLIGNAIKGLVHGVGHVVSGAVGFVAGAIGGAFAGVGHLVDSIIGGAIKGAIHHTGAGLHGKYAKTGWNHPVLLKRAGTCNSISEKLCGRMADDNSKGNPKGLKYMSLNSAHKAPEGCFVYKDQFIFNQHKSNAHCSKTKVCMCEVCAKKTKGVRQHKTGVAAGCCHLPFQYNGKLYTDCTTAGCWGWFCKPWCAVTDVMDGANSHMWDRCANAKKKDVSDVPTNQKSALLKKVIEEVQDMVEEQNIAKDSKDVVADWNDKEQPREKLV